MNAGFIALNVFLLAALTFVFVPPFIRNLKRTNTNFIQVFRRPGVRYGLFYIYLFSVAGIIIVCFSDGFNKDKDPDEIINDAKKEGLFDQQYYAYNKKLEVYGCDYKSLYYFHLTHKQSEDAPRFWEQDEIFSSIHVNSGYEYDELIQSKTLMDRELGYFGAAVVQFIYYKNDEETIRLLDSLRIKNKPFVHCLYGLAESDINKKKNAFLDEIAVNGCKEDAVAFFSRLCYNNVNYKGFDKLYNDQSLRGFIPPFIKQDYAYRMHYFFDYFLIDFQIIFSGTKPYVLFSALLILCLWLFFLRSIDVFEKEKPNHVIFAFALSLIGFLLSSLLYDLANNELHFNFDGTVANDFLYSVFGIGLIEEFVKILPLLIILRVKKIKCEPLDYIFYAGTGALVFSVLEDVMYFNRESLRVIYSRAIFTSLSHIADTAIIAYFMVLGKFYYKKHRLLLFLSGFLIACLFHGIYDLFAINEEVKNWFIPSFILLLEAWIFVHIVNNCLNNSPNHSADIRLNTRNVAIVVSGGLFLNIILVYLHTALNISGQYATWMLFMALIYYSYIIFFFNVTINRIDIFPGEWNRFSLRYFLDPKVFFAGIHTHYYSVPGKKIRFSAYGKRTQNILSYLPLITTVDKRIKISDYTGWFVCNLEYPIVLGGRQFYRLYFRTKDKNEPLGPEDRATIAIYILKNPDIKEENITLKDLVFIDWVFGLVKHE